MRIRNIINQVVYYRKKYGVKKTIRKIISKIKQRLQKFKGKEKNIRFGYKIMNLIKKN